MTQTRKKSMRPKALDLEKNRVRLKQNQVRLIPIKINIARLILVWNRARD